MDVERARRTHAVFTRAVTLPPDERGPVIAAECAGDDRLAAEVRRLLDAADRSNGFLESPALSGGTRVTLPDALGSYLVVGVLGVGGMATVYEAIQENPNRRVALKVMHQSVANTEAYLRFRLEAEVLARLQHPGIAQIYEAGTAQVGRPAPLPFFAMELIPGAVTITEHARACGLSTRERVAMLISVCDAVHHGHRHGVIHRDLKPGNVLVGADGRAKVIDFGVARTVGADVESITRDTDGRRLIGTLSYMSPEQCSGRGDIDTRADVYALGVLLYELLCHRLPHDHAGRPMAAIIQAVLNERPRPPALPRDQRDLEAIVLKAIEKDPGRRYDSASSFAADLRRWLESRPTEARPPGPVDHLRLFARRRPAAVVAGLSTLAAAVLITAISTLFAVRLAEEARRREDAELQARAERDEARRSAYAAQIAGAISAAQAGEFQQLRSRLASASFPLRGWEWGYLQRIAERSELTVAGHPDMIFECDVDEARGRLVTGAADGSVRLWDAASLSILGSHQIPSGARVLSIAFSPDGRYVLAGDDEGVVHRLSAPDLANAEMVAQLSTPVRGLAYLPGGRFAAATSDGAAHRWSDDLAVQARLPDDQPGGIQGLSISTDASRLVTFNDAGEVWVRDPGTFEVTARLSFPGAVYRARFSPDSGLLAAAGSSGRVLLWRLPDGELLHEIAVTGGVNTVRSIAFSHDGRLLAAGLIHRGIALCSTADGAVIANIGGHTEAVSGLAFSPDDQVLLSTSWDRTLRRWRLADVLSPHEAATLTGHTNHILATAFSPDGALIASAARDGSLRLWDPILAEPIASFSPGEAALHDLAISPDGRTIAAAGSGSTIFTWDLLTGAPGPSLAGPDRGITALAYDSSGARLAAGVQSGNIRIWDVNSSAEPIALTGHTARANAVAFSPDGALLASASRDKSVRLWDSRTGQELHRLLGHESDVFAVLFTPDGRRLLSGSRDQSIRLWDPATGACLRTIDGHGQYVTSLALSPDSTRLAAGSWFGEIVLFDVHSFDLLASIRAHESAIRAVAFSPDGRWLASASYDSTVRLHDSIPRAEADRARAAARAAQSAAIDRVTPVLQGLAGPGDVPEALTRAGLDPADPWVRKAVLRSLTQSR